MRTTIHPTLSDLVPRVCGLIEGRLKQVALRVAGAEILPSLYPGKLLRSSLAARLVAAGVAPPCAEGLVRVCAATEMAHTASLCHDDVIDNGLIRRGAPTLWRTASPSGAVLIGDLLLCDALDLLFEAEGGRYVRMFVDKVREVCAAEAEQELRWRGNRPDADTCLRLARTKTGPLFAFVAQVCGGDHPGLSLALEEAGYRIGTAYQLADDLLDVVGTEQTARKTLGTDSRRLKFTLPQDAQGARAVRQQVADLCRGAFDCAGAWPEARAGLAQFFTLDLQPAFDRHGINLDVCMDVPR